MKVNKLVLGIAGIGGLAGLLYYATKGRAQIPKPPAPPQPPQATECRNISLFPPFAVLKAGSSADFRVLCDGKLKVLDSFDVYVNDAKKETVSNNYTFRVNFPNAGVYTVYVKVGRVVSNKVQINVMPNIYKPYGLRTKEIPS